MQRLEADGGWGVRGCGCPRVCCHLRLPPSATTILPQSKNDMLRAGVGKVGLKLIIPLVTLLLVGYLEVQKCATSLEVTHFWVSDHE